MSSDTDIPHLSPCPAGDVGFSLADPEPVADPHPFYRTLRQLDAVHFDEKLGMYVVARHEDIMTVLRDAATFSQGIAWNRQFGRGRLDQLKAILIRDGGGYFPDVLQSDPPLHTRIRALLEKAFSAHRIRELEPRIRAFAVERVESLADLGRADGIADLAIPLTTDIMCEQLGFPHAEAAHRINQWGRAYIAQVHQQQSDEEFRANAALICDLQRFIIARIHERETKRSEDMISDLIYARLEEGEETKLTFEETVALTRGLLIAGNDTTSRAITNFLYVVSTQPEVAAHLESIVDDDARLSRFVEELLRYSPPVRALFRAVTRDTELGGTLVPEGATVMMLFASGNDDEAVFACPRTFDADRKNVIRHVAFGGGIHLCAGIALARMEIKTTLREVVTRLKGIRLAIPPEEVRIQATASYRAIESLPITFARRN